MFYSSGTTGRPKGILPSRPSESFGASGGSLGPLMQGMYGFSSDSVFSKVIPPLASWRSL